MKGLRGDEAEERLIKMGYTKDTCKLYLSRSGIKYIKYIAVHIHVVALYKTSPDFTIILQDGLKYILKL